MFEDAGKKIKDFAKTWFVIQCVAVVVGGVSVLTADEDLIWLFLLIVVGGFFVAWLSSLLLYGFGEIVDTAIANRYVRKAAPPPKTVASYGNSGTQRVPAQSTAQNRQNQPAAQNQSTAGSDSWICSVCKTKNLSTRTSCWSCGASTPANEETHD